MDAPETRGRIEEFEGGGFACWVDAHDAALQFLLGLKIREQDALLGEDPGTDGDQSAIRADVDRLRRFRKRLAFQ